MNNWAIGEKTYKLIDYNDEFEKNIIIRHHIPVKDLLFLANSKDGYKKNLPSLNNFEKLIKENTLIIAHMVLLNIYQEYFALKIM